jgi:hypothetical protein
MVKKGLAALLVAAAAVSAQALSWGMSSSFGSEFGGGLEGSASGLEVTLSGKHEISYFTMSPCFFFDVTYLELSVGTLLGWGKSTTTWSGAGFPLPPDEELSITAMSLTVGALGKYPIEVNDRITVFPLAGIGYQMYSSVDDKDWETVRYDNGKPVARDMDALWFRLGIGMDVGVSGSAVYARLAALYGVRLATKYEKDLKDAYEKVLEPYKDAGGAVDVQTVRGHGLTVRIAFGYRL